MRRAVVAACGAAALLVPANVGANAPLRRAPTVEEVVSTRPVTGTAPTDFTWSPDGTRYAYRVPAANEKAAPVLHAYDLTTGRDLTLGTAESGARGTRSRAISQLVWSPDSRRLAFVDGGELRMQAAAGGEIVRLTREADDPEWAPDGRRIAFVRSGDLCTIDTSTKRTTCLTRGGSESLLNGDPDWLYSEELDLAHAYAWSPRGNAIAYLRFDESHVTPFPIQQYLGRENVVERQRYPLAGEANPRVSLHVVDLATGADRTLYDGGRRDEYLATIGWRPRSDGVVLQVLDRAQRRLRLDEFPAGGGAPRTILQESDARFVDAAPAPRFLADGKAFVWLSARGDVRAAYLVDARTGVARRLTSGFPVAALLAVDDARRIAYVDARFPTRRRRSLVAVPLDGQKPYAITRSAGTHDITMAPRGGGYIDRFSTAQTPPIVLRRNVRGSGSATLFRTPSLQRFAVAGVRLLEIPSAYGALDATMFVPPDFDPARRYPVILNPYGGPLPLAAGFPSDDRFAGLMPSLYTARGYIVFVLDGPASRVDRASDVRRYYRDAGPIALAGQLAGTDWLVKQPYVDAARLGIWGWSFGGYLTAFALTHAPDTFKAGISGAPVVDWRFYDTCYTERYMGSPKAERAAYDRNSVLPAAGKLRAKLLIVQGSSDDNVHLANSVSLLEAFVNAGKQVEYFLYPGARHGVTTIAGRRHLVHKMLDFWQRTL